MIEIIKQDGGGGSGIESLNGLTATDQFLAVGTSGTDFAISSSVDTSTFNLPTASAINRGALSAANWSTFNGKQDALVSGTNIKTINSTSILGSGNLVVAAAPSGVSGAVQFSDGSALASDATNFFWDDTNDRLGIGTNTPSDRLTILGNSTSPIRASLRNTNANGDTQISLKNDTTGAAGFQVTGTTYFGNPSAYFFTQGGLEKLSFTTDGDLAAGGSGFITFLTGGYNASQERMRILSNGNIGIGTNAPAAKLSVKGNGTTTATRNTQWINSAGNDIGNLNDAGNISFTGKASFGNAGSGSILNIRGSGATSATSSVSVINSASTSLLYVGDDGKIGVGTSAPTAKLEIIGSGVTNATSSLLVKNSGSTVIVRSYDSGGFATGLNALAAGANSFASGENANASGAKAAAFAESIASGINSFAFGGGTASGTQSFAYGNGANASGIHSAALGWRNKAQGAASLSTGSKANSYYPSTRTHAAVQNTGNLADGDAQWSESHFALEAALTTGATSFLLTGDANETLANKLIPEGTNRVWNVKLSIISVVSLITGTATGVTVGDIYMENQYLCFSKLGGVSSVFGTVDKTNQKNSASLSTMLFDVIPNVTNQAIQIQVTAPTFAGGGSVTLINSCKIEFTEVAY